MYSNAGISNYTHMHGLVPFPVIVTTRIISCLVGDSYKLSFATISGKGDNPTYPIYSFIHIFPSLCSLFSIAPQTIEFYWEICDVDIHGLWIDVGFALFHNGVTNRNGFFLLSSLIIHQLLMV